MSSGNSRRLGRPFFARLLVLFVLSLQGMAVGAQTAPAPAPSPLPGDVVPEFDAVALAGRVEHVAFPKGSTTVLLFFLSSCPHCHQMIPRWNQAYDKRGKDVKAFGIILDQEPPGFFAALPVSFPVLRSPGRDFTMGLKVMRTPTALRIGPSGKIEEVQVGISDVMSVGNLFRAAAPAR